MENYKIIQRLGSSENTWLVESRVDSKKYALKMLECNDESEANILFKKAMMLQKLHHDHVCGYKEFFVTWSNEDSAMMFCFVTNYFRKGDLEKYLKESFSSKEPINEMVLKRWFGQLLNVLMYLQKKQVSHGNLKSRNVYLTEDMHLVIGNFSVPTISKELHRSKGNTAIEHVNWMPLDEKQADLRELAVILFQMATCSIINASQTEASMREMKSSVVLYEEMLVRLNKVYSNMLMTDVIQIFFSERCKQITIEQLIDIPFAKECLLLATVKKAKVERPIELLPCDQSVIAVLNYIKLNETVRECQEKGLEVLIELAERGVQLNAEENTQMTGLMKRHTVNATIQTKACILLTILATRVKKDPRMIYDNGVVSAVIQAIKNHPLCLQLQITAIRLLMALSADKPTAREIGRLGGVQDTICALRTFPNNSELAIYCCGALWSFSIDSDNTKVMSDEQVIYDVCKVLRVHSTNPALCEYACSLLWSISMEESNYTMMEDGEVVGYLLATLKLHKHNKKVVKNAFMAISNVISCAECFAYEVFRGDEHGNGVDIILDAFALHMGNCDITQYFASCMKHLSKYVDLCRELNAKDARVLLVEAEVKSMTNKHLCSLLHEAITSLNDS